jgi:hypothetical protein
VYWPAGAGFSESFTYDDLNRLGSATVSGFPPRRRRGRGAGRRAHRAVRAVTTGRARDVKPIVWVIAAVFVFRFAWLH